MAVKGKVASHRHKERINIPTEELREFVAEDEEAQGVVRYARDPSLDPQLVWKGKDEQDSEDLVVPVVPIYIQEKIHPQAIVESLRSAAPASDGAPDLFGDFNGIGDDFEKKIDFYNHESADKPHWSNRIIHGASL